MITAIAIRRSYAMTTALSVLTLLSGLLSVAFVAPLLPLHVGTLLSMDGFALVFTAILVAGSIAICLLAHGYFVSLPGHREEFSVLVVLATVGAITLVASTHFITFFLGLELLSTALYVMLAFVRTDEPGLESGLKYLVLGGVSSAFVLFGMALVYADTGSLAWSEILARAAEEAVPHAWLFAGVALLLVGIGFKLALVPFHLWVPDVYEGATAPATAFVATVSKAAVFALLFRYFAWVEGDLGSSLRVLLAAVAMASILAGNLLALLQKNVKRLLAYSSIAHLGYLLVAVLSKGPLALPAAGLYLTAYVITMLGALGVVTLLSRPGDEAGDLESYRGLFWRAPALSVVFAAMLLSLAGIPLTAGFVGKLYLVTAGVSSAEWALVMTLVAGSVIGVFYYLRVLVTLFQIPDGETEASAERLPLAGSLVLAALTMALVWIGLFPGAFVDAFRLPIG
jgi:NADH-quinone oxidoreductase subunit N